MTGAVLSASTIAAVLSGCQPDGTADPWTPQALTQPQADLLSDLCETILPRTDTPGAMDLGVPAFIDDMVANFMDQKSKKHFVSGLDQVEKDAQAQFGKAFLELDEASKVKMLTAYDQEAYDYNENREGVIRDPDELPPFFGKLKGLTFTGYFLTETGASQVLKYEWIPGGYEGCIPLEEVGGAWVDA